MFKEAGVVVAFGLAVTGCAVEASDGSVETAEQAIAGGGLLPDIVEEPPFHLGVQNQQQRESLRFTSTHWNAGEGKLQIRGGGEVAPCIIDGPEGPTSYDQCTYSTQEILDAAGNVVAEHPAGVAVFHPEHNHWHQDNVADFVLRAGGLDGPIVVQGVKVTYCLIDYDKVDAHPGTRTYFDCNAELQGISPGWGDEYHHATHGQELDITSLPTGTYYLTHLADPTDKWLESDDDNNFSWVKIALTRTTNAQVTVLEKSPCTDLACGNTANK